MVNVLGVWLNFVCAPHVIGVASPLNPEYSDHSVASQPLSTSFEEECMNLSYDVPLRKCESVYNTLKITVGL